VGKATAAKEAARKLAQKEAMKAEAIKAAARKAAAAKAAPAEIAEGSVDGHEATAPAIDAGEVETVRRLSFTLDEVERARLVPKVKF
jgi:hypothetical protein